MAGLFWSIASQRQMRQSSEPRRTATEATTVSEIADWKFTPGRITEQLMSDYTDRGAAQRQSRRGLAPRLDRVALTAARPGRAIGR